LAKVKSWATPILTKAYLVAEDSRPILYGFTLEALDRIFCVGQLLTEVLQGSGRGLKATAVVPIRLGKLHAVDDYTSKVTAKLLTPKHLVPQELPGEDVLV